MTTNETVIDAIERALQSREAYRDGDEVRFQATCHDDRDPSARWNPAKRTWFCDVCKIGGGWRDLAQRLGLSIAPSSAGSAKREFERAYDYVSPSGELLFQCVRFKVIKTNGTLSKTFAQRRPDGDGEWIWNLQGVELVVYRLNQLKGQASVFICEGEKDVDRCWSLGLAATCNPMGARKWGETYTAQLIKAGVGSVCILPDNDPIGREHADMVAASCLAAGLAVKVVALPDLPPKGDVSDFFDAGQTAEDLRALAEAAPEWTPESVPADGASPGPDEPYRLTDLGNAERLVRRYGSVIRYCYPEKRWYVLDETSGLWRRDPGNLIAQLAKSALLSIYEEARQESDEDRRVKLAAHAVKSESQQRLQATVELAKAEPGIAISPNAFDADPWLFSVVNGVLDLRTGRCRDRRPDDFVTKVSPVRFEAGAACPTWLRFLDRVLQGDEPLMAYLQQLSGYCLTGSTGEQALWILWGSGANGKSTLLKVLLALLGDYGLQVPAETFLSRIQDGRATPDLARLQGARLAVALETDDGSRLAEGILKQMTGGDRITARRLYQDIVEFEPTHKILLATNHKPRVRDNSDGMWRRMRLIPFEVQIPEREQDPMLGQKLLEELPGILNWALEGCLAWQQAGRLRTPGAVIEATASYRVEQDALDDFLRERCVVERQASAAFAELRKGYTSWADDRSERPLSSKAFAAALQERGFRPVLEKNARHYAGLRLRTIDDDLADAQRARQDSHPGEPQPVAAGKEAVDVDLDY